MRNNGQLILGGSILLFGLIILLGNLLDISLWAFIWPIILIALGIFIIFRQRNNGGHSEISFSFASNMNRTGQWKINSGEFWRFVTDLDLDFTNAEIPEGEHVWKIFGFVHEIRLRVPSNLAVSVSTHAFVNEKKINGECEDLIFVPMKWQSENFNNSPNKFRIEATGFVVDTRITTYDQN